MLNIWIHIVCNDFTPFISSCNMSFYTHVVRNFKSIISIVFNNLFCLYRCLPALQHVSQAGQLDQKPAADIKKCWNDCQGYQRFNQASERDSEPSHMQRACRLFSDSEAERRGKTWSFAFCHLQHQQQCIFYNMWMFFFLGLWCYGHSLPWEKLCIYCGQPVWSWYWYHSSYVEMGFAAYGQISTYTR